jgi:hypothetical protein
MSPTSSHFIKEHMQAFVDDSHGIMILDPSDPTTLNTMITQNLQQQWEALLHTVGGKLEINKCRYIRFGPNHEAPPQHQHDTSITIIDHETNEPLALTEITHSTPYKLLGIEMAFDGNCQAQYKTFRDKCEKMAFAFTRWQLSADDTLQGYRSIFLPRVRYGTEATNIPVSQIHKAQLIVTGIVLPKMGYNKTLRPPILSSSSFKHSCY